jgi:sulfonate transport system permease protein
MASAPVPVVLNTYQGISSARTQLLEVGKALKLTRWQIVTRGSGIGDLIIAGRERFQMDLVTLEILIRGLVGFPINRCASLFEARLLRCRPT